MGTEQRGVRRRVLFVFLDGVGLAPAGPDNPLSQVQMPCLHGLLGGPLVLDRDGRVPSGSRGLSGKGGRARSDWSVVVRALDACLGVPGLPQSATGQASLFTGVNAPALVGDHVTAFPTAPLRDLIARKSLLKRAAEAGARVTFANAHSERFWRMIDEGKRRLGASTLAALAGGVDIPTLVDLAEGRAVLWDITHEVATRFLDYDLPIIEPETAGGRLARLSAEYDLVLFESFLTDLAGHGRIEPAWALVRVDAMLQGVLRDLPPGVTLVLSSDHGNLEDQSTRQHTTNPVPLLAVGPDAAAFQGATAITHVAGAILSVCAVTHDPASALHGSGALTGVNSGCEASER